MGGEEGKWKGVVEKEPSRRSVFFMKWVLR
jgi:hypothetical protein